MSQSIPVRPDVEQRIRDVIRGDVPWSLRYLNEFVLLKCAPDLLALGVFPNAKEISESMGAYNAVRQHLRHCRMDDATLMMVAVGDGHKPRTAATFAYRTAWQCVSVDPELGGHGPYLTAIRLSRLACKVEEIDIERMESNVVIVCVHSHAKLEAALEHIKAPRRDVVAIQCCVPQVVTGRKPDIEYRDWGILSPENLVKVWRDV